MDLIPIRFGEGRKGLEGGGKRAFLPITVRCSVVLGQLHPARREVIFVRKSVECANFPARNGTDRDCIFRRGAFFLLFLKFCASPLASTTIAGYFQKENWKQTNFYAFFVCVPPFSRFPALAVCRANRGLYRFSRPLSMPSPFDAKPPPLCAQALQCDFPTGQLVVNIQFSRPCLCSREHSRPSISLRSWSASLLFRAKSKRRGNGWMGLLHSGSAQRLGPAWEIIRRAVKVYFYEPKPIPAQWKKTTRTDTF